MDNFIFFIKNRNFKRIFIIWLICTIIAILACTGVLYYSFKDKLSFADQIDDINDDFKKSENVENMTFELDILAEHSEI